MKKAIYLLLSIFVFTSCNQDEEILDVTLKKGKPEKITICHYNPHNDTWKTISVLEKHLAKHLEHGDKRAPCGYTYVPDVNFEQALIDLSIDTDGVINQSVLTSDISPITELDVSGKNISDLTGIEDFINLTSLAVGNGQFASNHLTSLDLSKNTALTYLNCDRNKLTSLDVSQNTNLRVFWCQGNGLSTLDLTHNTVLTELECSENNLTSLDVSKNLLLKQFGCGQNQLTSLDVSNNTALTRFALWNNPITSIELSKNVTLTSMSISSTEITSIDLSKNIALTALNISNTKVTSLDLRQNTALTELGCYDGNHTLTSVYLTKNTSLPYYIAVYGNPNLTCIQVDDAAWFTANPSVLIDPCTIFSEDCSITETPPKIGDFYQGGIVFYILQPSDTGYCETSTNGLIAAPSDQSAGIQWYNDLFVTTNATGTAFGTGSTNTDLIILVQGPIETSYAAGLARAYNGGENNDWFLPSIDELNLMYWNIVHDPDRDPDHYPPDLYWSSTEVDVSTARGMDFNFGSSFYAGKQITRAKVRAVRAF